jgi:hypothetical protein
MWKPVSEAVVQWARHGPGGAPANLCPGLFGGRAHQFPQMFPSFLLPLIGLV